MKGSTPVIEPLLIDEHQAATMLGISYWSVREYCNAGLLPLVAPPSPLNGRRRLRRRLIDRRDIEKFIAQHKQGGRA